MFEELTQRTAEAEKAVAEAKDTLSALEADETTPPATIAKKRAEAREVLAVCQERHAKARIALATAQAATLARDAAALRAEAATLDAKAEHAEASARGQVDGMYGQGAHDWLAGAGRFPLKAQELRSEAANKRGLAGQLDDDAKRIGGAK